MAYIIIYIYNILVGLTIKRALYNYIDLMCTVHSVRNILEL